MAVAHELEGGAAVWWHGLIYYFPLAHFCSFLLGIAGGAWYLAVRARITNLYLSASSIIVVSLLVVLCLTNESAVAYYLGFTPAFASSFFAPLFLALIMSLAISHSKITDLLSIKPLVVLGGASYSVYILQVPFSHIYSWAMSHVGTGPWDHGFLGYFTLLIATSTAIFLGPERHITAALKRAWPSAIAAKNPGAAPTL